jgi:phosphoribosyl-ATP pyrophosphohydrolase
MKEHQLPNNCYTICESTEQCKQLFDWAKANEIETMYDNYEDENCLAYEDALITTTVEDCIEDGSTFMPLAEFISKLQGNWEQPNEVTMQSLQDEAHDFVIGILPALTHEQQVKKILEEATELAESPNDETEYADVLISLLVAYKLKGGNTQDLLRVASQKMKINRERKWGKADSNGLIKHIK